MNVMGILNVTPDSFSDGGRWYDHDAAIAHGLQLVSDGADIIDIGGESTRPGAERVPIVEEQRRILPVIRTLSREGLSISVDTLHAETARAAVDAGASFVNDVSGGLADDSMLSLVGELDVPYIAMHWRGYLDNLALSAYDDVVTDVVSELEQRVSAMLAAGIAEDHIILDPGLGFHKGPQENWALLRHLDALNALGYPVLVGASRKRFLRQMLAEQFDGEIDEMHLLDTMTATLSVACEQDGAWGVRVHDVAGTRAALAVENTWTHLDTMDAHE